MSLIIGAFEYIRGFIGSGEYEGYLGDEKVFPYDGIRILNVWLNISASASNKPEEIEQKSITVEGYLPACGGVAATCNVSYEVEEDGNIVRKLAENIPLKEGQIEALYLGDTITETTLLGVRHIDLNIVGYDPISNFEVQIYQQANLQTITLDIVDEEASGPYHTAEYQDPVVSLSYTYMGANGQNTYALVDNISYYQDYVTKDYNLSAITHDEIDYTSGLHIATPPKGGVETDVVEQSQRYENEGADPFVWYIEEQTSSAVQFVNNADYNHAVKGVNRGKDDYTGGKVAKVTLVVPMNGRRGIAQVDIMQQANTMSEVWRYLDKYNEYEEYYTDIDISIFRYSTNTSWQIPASGEYRTPALVYSQDKYKDTYEINNRTQKYIVWASGAEEKTDEYQGGTRTLKKHELLASYSSGATVTYSVDYWRNTGKWYNQSKGYVAAADRADNAGDTRTLGTVTVTVKLNDKTATASTTVKQQYNREETDLSYWQVITPQSNRQYSYEYDDPVITSFSYTTTNFAASGGTATPSYNVSQTRDEVVSYTKAVEQYMQVFTSHPDDPYARGTRGGEKISDVVESGQTVPQSEIIVRFDGTKLNGSGVTLENSISGKITVPSLGTDLVSAQNIWTAKIVVTGGGVRAEKTLTISQRENKVESTSSQKEKEWSVGVYDLQGNTVSQIGSGSSSSFVAKAMASYYVTDTYSSGSTKDRDSGSSAINIQPTSDVDWLSVGNVYNVTYGGYILSASSNNLATNRSMALTWTRTSSENRRVYLTQKGVTMPKFNNCTTVGKITNNWFAVYTQVSQTPEGAVYSLLILYYNEATGSTIADREYNVNGTAIYKDKYGNSKSKIISNSKTTYLSTYGYYGIGVDGGIQYSWDLEATKLIIT